MRFNKPAYRKGKGMSKKQKQMLTEKMLEPSCHIWFITVGHCLCNASTKQQLDKKNCMVRLLGLVASGASNVLIEFSTHQLYFYN
jgi:hypothetical protein